MISLLPIWSATTVLASLNNDANTALFPSDNNDNIYTPTNGQDDEVNYVSLDLDVTTDTEIWAVDVSCSFATEMLEVYPVDSTGATDNPTDNQHPFIPSIAWGIIGTHYTQVNFPYTPGTLRVALSRIGQIPGLGVNGQTSTFSLGTMTLRIKPQNSAFEGAPKVSCLYSFVNRNGVVIGTSALPLIAPTLFVREGYSISGRVLPQMFAPVGSAVSCQTDMSTPHNTAPVVRVELNGAFKVNGLRTLGHYRCQYFTNIVGIEAATTAPDKDPEPFLAGQSYVPIFSSGYALQPITLRAGNTARVVGSEFDIDLSDISAVTGAPQFGTALLVPQIFSSGDANGDKKVDKTDLALVTSNFETAEYVSQGHYLVAGQFLPSAVPADSRVYMSMAPDDWSLQELRQLIPGTSRDFWPTVSPDGTQVAFIRFIGTGTTNRYALFVMPATGAGVPIQLTPASADYDAFAPSWSPDGKRLAFIRTPVSLSGNTLTCTYGTDKGWLTLVDLNTKVITLTLGIETRIYPAAWFDNDTVIYGSTATDTLERLYIKANITDAVFGPMQGGGIEEMPNIANGHLYYRYEPDANYATVDAELRFATLTQGGSLVLAYSAAPTPNAPGLYHMTVPTGSSDIAYYSVDRNHGKLVIQAATLNYSGVGNWTVMALTNAHLFTTQVPAWNVLNHLSLPLLPNPAWNGVIATPSDLHALRSTVISLP